MMDEKLKNRLFNIAIVVVIAIVAFIVLGFLTYIPPDLMIRTAHTPDEAMKQQMNDIQGKYSAGTTAYLINFKANSGTYNVKDSLSDYNNFTEGSIVFAYTSNALKFLKNTDSEKFQINENFIGVIISCGNPDIPRYVIAIGTQKEQKATLLLCREKRDE